MLPVRPDSPLAACSRDSVPLVTAPRRGKKPARKRKEYAWERGVVKSSVPAGEQKTKCSGCGSVHQTKALRFGYCSACWSPDN